MSGGGGTTTQKNDPWSGIQPYLLGQEAQAATPGTSNTFGGDGGYASGVGFSTSAISGGQPAKPAIPGLLSEAAKIYGSTPPQFYGGQMYANFDPLQTESQNAIVDYARKGDVGVQNASSYINNLMAGGGGAPAAALGMSGDPSALRSMIGGFDPSSQYYNRAMAGNMLYSSPEQLYLQDYASGAKSGQNPLQGYLGGTASGRMLNANPNLDAMYNTAANQVTRSFKEATMPSIDSSLALAGRYGGDAQANLYKNAQNELGQNLSSLAANVYGQNYESERNRQLQAAQMLGNVYQGDISNQMNAAGAIGGAYGRERSLQQGAAGDLGGQRLSALAQLQSMGDTAANRNLSAWQTQGANALTAAGMAPGLADYRYGEFGKIGDVGAQLQAQAQLGINQDINKWNYNQNLPWQQLQQYANILKPAMGIGGSQTTQQNMDAFPMLLGAGTQLGGAYLMGGGLASSKRFKHDVKPLENSEEIISALKPVSFVWNGNGESDTGFIAEEVRAILPQAAIADINGETFGLKNEMQIMAHLVKTVQGLMARVSELESAACPA